MRRKLCLMLSQCQLYSLDKIGGDFDRIVDSYAFGKTWTFQAIFAVVEELIGPRRFLEIENICQVEFLMYYAK